jgi:hypothetical protein
MDQPVAIAIYQHRGEGQDGHQKQFQNFKITNTTEKVKR